VGVVKRILTTRIAFNLHLTNKRATKDSFLAGERSHNGNKDFSNNFAHESSNENAVTISRPAVESS